MGVFFGTDGLRGEIGNDLNHEIAYNCGNALGKLFTNSNILLGKDTRISGDYIATAFASGVISSGSNITYIGVCPTPGIAYLANSLNFDYAVAITASHNPMEHNGIKIFDNNYRKIADKKEELLERNFFHRITVPNSNLGHIFYKPHLIRKYKNFLLSNSNNFENLHIALDCANGATGRIAKYIFEKTGAKVSLINTENSGLNINKDCGATSTSHIQKLVTDTHADVGFAFDGDGDRVIAIDKDGSIIDGDQIIYILTKYYIKSNKLRTSAVVGTRHTNMGMELALNKLGVELYRTDIGDKFVSSKLIENNLQIGGEQSGHIILRDLLPTGDGILTAITLCKIISEEKLTLKDLCDYTPSKQCNKSVKTNHKLNIINSEKLSSAINRYESKLRGKGRIMVRVSGTEPVIRIMVESDCDDTSQRIASNIESIIIEIDKEQNLCAE